MKIKMNALFLLIAMSLFLPVSAQKDSLYKRGRLTEKQMEALKSLDADMDKKINLAFVGNEKLKKEMSEALAKINAIKDLSIKKKEITAYQNKYYKVYGDVLKKGSVSIQDYAKKYQKILPDYQVTVVNNYAIMANLKSMATGVISLEPLKYKTTTRLSDFDQIKSGPCALAAAGTVDFTSNSIEVYSVAAVAGGCFMDGTMSKEVDLKNVSKASARIKYNITAEAFAIGVVGLSRVDMAAWGYTTPKNVAIADYRTDMANEVFTNIKIIAAPFLWAMQGNILEPGDKTVTLTPGYTNLISFIASVGTIAAFISETHGTTTLSGVEVELTSE